MYIAEFCAVCGDAELSSHRSTVEQKDKNLKKVPNDHKIQEQNSENVDLWRSLVQGDFPRMQREQNTINVKYVAGFQKIPETPSSMEHSPVIEQEQKALPPSFPLCSR